MPLKNKGELIDTVLRVIAETVNGRMDNCGGGQRLPPDGDEFPAAYQEFGGNSQQYRFVTTTGATRSSTMTANGEPFIGSENFKLIESNVVTTGSTILSDNSRVGLTSVENVCQEVSKVSLPNIEINGKASAETVCQDASILAREPRVDDGKPYIAEDFVKKTASVSTYSSYGSQTNGNVAVSEQKIDRNHGVLSQRRAGSRRTAGPRRGGSGHAAASAADG